MKVSARVSQAADALERAAGAFRRSSELSKAAGVELLRASRAHVRSGKRAGAERIPEAELLRASRAHVRSGKRAGAERIPEAELLRASRVYARAAGLRRGVAAARRASRSYDHALAASDLAIIALDGTEALMRDSVKLAEGAVKLAEGAAGQPEEGIVRDGIRSALSSAQDGLRGTSDWARARCRRRRRKMRARRNGGRRRCGSGRPPRPSAGWTTRVRKGPWRRGTRPGRRPAGLTGGGMRRQWRSKGGGHVGSHGGAAAAIRAAAHMIRHDTLLRRDSRPYGPDQYSSDGERPGVRAEAEDCARGIPAGGAADDRGPRRRTAMGRSAGRPAAQLPRYGRDLRGGRGIAHRRCQHGPPLTPLGRVLVAVQDDADLGRGQLVDYAAALLGRAP